MIPTVAFPGAARTSVAYPLAAPVRDLPQMIRLKRSQRLRSLRIEQQEEKYAPCFGFEAYILVPKYFPQAPAKLCSTVPVGRNIRRRG